MVSKLQEKSISDILQALQLPISLAVQSYKKNRPFIIGITGSPGVGKTTTAKILFDNLSTLGTNIFMASLEDFYFAKEKREELGIQSRALPGSHDIKKLIRILDNIKNNMQVEYIPRYCMVNDRPLAPLNVNSIIKCFILEGWILNTNIHGYQIIGNYIDYLIYLDTDIEYAKKWRFEREDTYRKHYQAGFTENQMHDFWNNTLEPGIKNWVIPQKNKADLIINFDNNHNVI